MDEIHMPVGIGDHLLKQMLARSRSDRKITFSVGGEKMFKEMFITLDDLEHDIHTRSVVTFQDLEHVNLVLDDMECRLNDYLEGYPG